MFVGLIYGLMLVVAQAARQDLPRRGTFQVTWDGWDLGLRTGRGARRQAHL
jgi:hypothetical protein